jgi:CRP-like cAMP-binding protein
MTIHTIEDLIAAHPFFSGLGDEFVKFVAGCGRNRFAEAGEYFAHEGDPAVAFYLIRRGKVAVETNVPGRGAVTLETLGPGDIAGWSWFFPPHKWTFDLKAVEETSMIELSGQCLREKCDGDPRLGYEVAKRLAAMIVDRLRATRLRLLDLYGDQAR